MDRRHHRRLSLFPPPQIRRAWREWHCARQTRRRARLAPLPGRPTPHGPCWPRLFHFATVAASDPGRVSNSHTTSDSGRHIARRSDNATSLRCHFLPFAMLSPLLRFSSACPLLTLPPPVPPLRLHHPLSYPRPPPGLASLCTCVKSRPKPAAPRRPPRAPVLDMDAAAADDSPARPSPPWPPWYHLTASPAANPPGSRLVTPSIGQKNPLSHLANTTAPLSSSSALAAPSLPNIRSYTRARGS